MAFSEHLLGLSWITTPVIWLSGNPLLGYNAAFFLSFPLCALSAYFLTVLDRAAPRLRVRRRPRVRLCAVPHGAVRARPGAVRLLDAARARGAPSIFRGSAEAAGWCCSRPRWFMQALACGYYLFYLSVLVGLWLLWFPAGRERWRALVARRPRSGPWRPRCWRPCSTATGSTSTPTACGGGRTRSCRSARTSRACSRPRTISGSGAGSTSSIIPSRRLFPGITPILLIIVGLAIALEPRGEGTNRRRCGSRACS